MWSGVTARSATRSAARRRRRTSSPRSRSSSVAAEFTGKVVLITGVGRVGQIGHAVAKAFGEAGARPVLAGGNAPAPARRAQELAAPRIAAGGTAGGSAAPARA